MRKFLLVFPIVLVDPGLAEARPARPQPTAVNQTQLGASLHDWHIIDPRQGGSALVSYARPDRRRRSGSLELTLPASGGPDYMAAVEIFSEDVILLPGEGLRAFDGGFGLLKDLRAARFRWYRDATSTAPVFLAPAFRLIVHDPDAGEYGSTWELVWEAVYNGYSVAEGVPTDRWVRSDVRRGYVWRLPLYLNGVKAPANYCAQNRGECYRYDRRPQDWGFGPNAAVIGVQVAAGSGWSGSFLGYADNVRLRFKRGRNIRWNFEP